MWSRGLDRCAPPKSGGQEPPSSAIRGIPQRNAGTKATLP